MDLKKLSAMCAAYAKFSTEDLNQLKESREQSTKKSGNEDLTQYRKKRRIKNRIARNSRRRNNR